MQSNAQSIEAVPLLNKTRYVAIQITHYLGMHSKVLSECGIANLDGSNVIIKRQIHVTINNSIFTVISQIHETIQSPVHGRHSPIGVHA